MCCLTLTLTLTLASQVSGMCCTRRPVLHCGRQRPTVRRDTKPLINSSKLVNSSKPVNAIYHRCRKSDPFPNPNRHQALAALDEAVAQERENHAAEHRVSIIAMGSILT